MRRKILISNYGNNITSKDLGNRIYCEIKDALAVSDVELDFSNVATMTTFCAKSIFGRLYGELGPEAFYVKIKILNTNQDVKIIINEGLIDFISDQQQ